MNKIKIFFKNNFKFLNFLNNNQLISNTQFVRIDILRIGLILLKILIPLPSIKILRGKKK
jgi:hypothetical protein